MTIQFGIVLNKKIGDYVKHGEVLAVIHANVEEKAQKAIEEMKSAYKIEKEEVERQKVIIDIIK